MPSIQEEDATLGEFFDFNNAVSDNIHQFDETAANGSLNHTINAAESDLCNQFSQEAGISGPGLDEELGDPAEDYSNFSKWIPRFVQPDEPCTYCRERQLQCYLSYGKVTCTACDTLFRQCSFVKAHRHSASPETPEGNTGLVDTLHSVAEDCCQEQGELTGVRPLKSKPDAPKKATSRFPRAAVKVLRDWLEEHSDKPYPTEDEKAHLARVTGLRLAQVNNWLANARRRGKVGKNNVAIGGSSTGQSEAIGIPVSANINVTNWSNLNPLERWKHSPPQNEPAPMTAIADALGRGDLPPHEDELSSPSTLGYHGFGSSRDDSSHSNRRAPSMTSLERSTSHSGTSSAAWSGSHESRGSFSSFGSSLNGKRERRRRRKVPNNLMKKQIDDTKKRIYQCTFCTDNFVTKYDWTRHEKSLHLSLEKYVCCPLGPETLDPSTGQRICAYCCDPEPTKDHLETHNHKSCVEKGMDARTFYRKDHLRQHLRLVHESKMLSHMEEWKTSMAFINSRCGFCSQRFTGWSERNDHIAGHFKDGAKMKDWRGCRGLDPAIAALVNSAMPPYLIGEEAVTPNPFSATFPKRCMTLESHYENGGPPTTCWEILTVRLGRYAKEQTDKGIIVSDEMLQAQARRILYDSDDAWNQTAADNPEWLDLFKRAHALDYIPTEISGTGKNIPDDLEMYGDLGMRIPFMVQLERGAKLEDAPPGTAASFSARQQRQAQEQERERREELDQQAPPKKNYPRFSSVPIPLDRAAAFETMCGPWPASGVRGPIVYTNSSSARSSLSHPSTQDHPHTPASDSQQQATTNPLQPKSAQLETPLELDYFNADIDSLMDATTTNMPPPPQPSAGDLARRQNALTASQHGMMNLTPQQAQNQLAEMNVAMAGIASAAPSAAFDVPLNMPDLFAGLGDFNASISDADFIAMTSASLDPVAAPQQHGMDWGFGDDTVMPATTTASVDVSNADTLMNDVDFNDINFGDMDFNLGFTS